MKLNIIEPPKPGDRRVLKDGDLDRLQAEGCYDSYSRVYIIEGLVWRVIEKVCRIDGSTDYTLLCEGRED